MILSRHGKRLGARHEAADLQRKYVTRLPRKPYRAQNSHKIKISKTPAEKKVVADQRAERREQMVEALATARDKVADEARKMQAEFGLHDEKYYQHQILQQARTEAGQRKTNRWNAYLKNELEKLNADLPAGAPRYSSTGEMGSQIAERWKDMSAEEKVEVTKDLVKELDDAKEMRSLSVQSVPVNVFHDVRATMGAIFEQLRRLHARTGLEIAVISVRSDRAQFVPPMSFATSTRVYDFFQVTTGNTLDDLACSLEAYSLSGVSGLVERSIDVIQGLQSRASSLISQRLGQVTQHTASKMFYAGFADHITTRFGVVIENWPLPRFTAPSAMRTRLELTTLINAWETDVTRFRKLSKPEWEQWELQQTNPDGPIIIRAVTVAGFTSPSSLGAHNTAGVAAGTASVPSGTPLPVASGSGDVASASHTSHTEQSSNDLVLPSAKPRKRRADAGKTHKKRRGNAPGTTDSATSQVSATRSVVSPSGGNCAESAAGGVQGVVSVTTAPVAAMTPTGFMAPSCPPAAQTLSATQSMASAPIPPSSPPDSMASSMVPASRFEDRTSYTAPSSTQPHATLPEHGVPGSFAFPQVAWQAANPPPGTAQTPAAALPPIFYFPPTMPSVDLLPESPFMNAGLPVQHNTVLPGGLHEWHTRPHFAIDPALTGSAHMIDPALTGGAPTIDPILPGGTIDPALTAPHFVNTSNPMHDTTDSSMPHNDENVHSSMGHGMFKMQFISYNGETARGGRGRGRGGRGGRARGRAG